MRTSSSPRTARTFACGLVVAAMALAAVGCSSGHGSPSATGDAASLYGAAPVPDSHVELQPDTVVVGGGAGSVKALSGDGLTWTLDKRAAHLDQAQIGKVLFLTNRAVGRVVARHEVDGGVEVTLAPVALNEIVRNGDFRIDQAMDLSQSFGAPALGAQQQIGSLAGNDAPPTSDGTTITTDAAPPSSGGPSRALHQPSGPSPAQPAQPAPASPAPALPAPGGGGGCANVVGSSSDLGDPHATPLFQNYQKAAVSAAKDAAGKVAGGKDPRSALPKDLPTLGDSVQFSVTDDFKAFVSVGANHYNAVLTVEKAGLVGGLQICFDTDKPSIKGTLTIADGKIYYADLDISGFKRMSIGLLVGSKDGLNDNLKSKIELPFDLGSLPITIYGIPFVITASTKFLIDTAFSAKNSILKAYGVYGIQGDLGFVYTDGKLETKSPTITVEQKMLDSIQSLSVGVNGIVFAQSLTLGFGLGVSTIHVGPSVSLKVAVGVTSGSDLGIIKCRSVTLDVTGEVSVDVKLPSIAKGILEKLAPDLTSKPLGEAKLFSKTGVMPDSKLCH